MKLTLIGMRGTGKTSVGSLIANQLGWSFVDADSAIVEQAGRTIAEIFATDGESTFRQIEEQVLAELLGSDKFAVIASGGGAVLSERTRLAMKEAGPVVWLTAPVEELARRLNCDSVTAAQRPSLTGRAVADELGEIYRQRRHLYLEVATISQPTQDDAPEALASCILNRLSDELSISSPVDGKTQESDA